MHDDIFGEFSSRSFCDQTNPIVLVLDLWSFHSNPIWLAILYLASYFVFHYFSQTMTTTPRSLVVQRPTPIITTLFDNSRTQTLLLIFHCHHAWYGMFGEFSNRPFCNQTDPIVLVLDLWSFFHSNLVWQAILYLASYFVFCYFSPTMTPCYLQV